MNNKELIRRALMGDKQAQEECTEKGIALPCPLCGVARPPALKAGEGEADAYPA